MVATAADTVDMVAAVAVATTAGGGSADCRQPGAAARDRYTRPIRQPAWEPITWRWANRIFARASTTRRSVRSAMRLVDEPNNAGLMMMTAQALFQTGKWTQAAAATELAMGALPEDKWGAVVQNYTQLYGNAGDFTNQLKALEAAVKAKPDDPALRFLLGFQYGYLKYPKQAVDELGKAVKLEGRDPAARKLHDLFAAKTGASPGRARCQQTAGAPNGAAWAAKISGRQDLEFAAAQIAGLIDTDCSSFRIKSEPATMRSGSLCFCRKALRGPLPAARSPLTAGRADLLA